MQPDRGVERQSDTMPEAARGFESTFTSRA